MTHERQTDVRHPWMRETGRQSRHKSERMAMTYIRPATLFDDNAAEGMGDDEPEGKR